MSHSHGKLIYAIDIGNSGLRIAQVSPLDQPVDPVRISWRLGHHSDLHVSAGQSETTSDKSPIASQVESRFIPGQSDWTRLLKRFVSSEHSSTWWISSVNRPACDVLTHWLDSQPNCHWKRITYQHVPMQMDVDLPERVGIDRLLAAYAACESLRKVKLQGELGLGKRHGCGELVVIQAGSAVTVDLVRIDSMESRTMGVFCGGAILPGVPMMLGLLGKAADLLPELDAKEMVALPELPGKNTEAAMKAGTSSCLVGGVQHLVARYRERYDMQLPVIVSGGDGPLLLPFLSPPVSQIPHMVLEGIRLLVTNESTQHGP